MDDIISRLALIDDQKWSLHESVVCNMVGIVSMEGVSRVEKITDLLKVLSKGGKGDVRRGSWEPSKYGIVDVKDPNNILK